MSTEHKTKVLIIGSGPAGYTAAIYAARANLKPIIVQGSEPGGQLTITTDVENYPGFAETIQGPWLMEQMEAQAKAVNTEIITDHIKSVDFSKRPFVCRGESGDTYIGETVVIATGAQAKWLGIPSEDTFQGRGVSACATCDGFFYRGKEVIVVGGGNTAVEEAIFLTNFASKVTLVHRRDTLKSEKILQDRLFANDKIELMWDSQIDEILGDDMGVTAARVENVKTGEMTEIPIHGIFIAIGHAPAVSLFKGQIELDAHNYIMTAPDSTATNVKGVYAAGDVKDSIYRQAVTAAGMGCMAALEIERFLSEEE
jgi:thioredoxin reductase (NADPH)